MDILKKNNPKFKASDLLNALKARSMKELTSDFLSENVKSLNIDDNVLYGLQAEAVFKNILFTLDECDLIQKIDTNDNVYHNKKILVPDFLVILKNKNRYVVEVKNCHSLNNIKKFTSEYIKKLLRYSELNACELKIAIYWSKFNIWTINSLGDFKIEGKKYCINFSNALKKSELSEYGDVTIGLKPPIIFKFFLDQKSAQEEADHLISFKIASIEMLYNNRVPDKKLKSFLVFLSFFGCWDFKKNVRFDKDKKINYLELAFNPIKQETNFSIIGSISSISSRYYKFMLNNGYKRIDVPPIKIDVDIFRKLKKDSNFPLWIFKIRKSNSN